MLNILQDRCLELGVELLFERDVESDTEFPDADLVIAADGVNSRIRNRYADVFRPDMAMRMAWKEIGEHAASEKPLTFWLRSLEDIG